MWFWWFMFVCNLFVPGVQIIAGRMMWKHCPQNINHIYGYRTKRSMINMDTWKFAHEHCGRIWWKVGWIVLVLSVLVQIPFYHSNEDAIAIAGAIICIIQSIILITSIIPVEVALKNTFREDGTRRKEEVYGI